MFLLRLLFGRAYERRVLAAGPTLPSFMVRDSRTLLDGVMVELSTAGSPYRGGPYVSARARREGGTTPRLLRDRRWDDRERPRGAAALAALPVRDGETRGDDDAARALPALAASWERLCAIVDHAILTSDGDQVVAWIVAERQEQVDHLATVVAAVARWDVAVATMLASLPESRPLHDGPLSPAVLLPGDVRVGLRGDILVVARGSASRAVERDPARILAAVAELRATRSSGPFR